MSLAPLSHKDTREAVGGPLHTCRAIYGHSDDLSHREESSFLSGTNTEIHSVEERLEKKKAITCLFPLPLSQWRLGGKRFNRLSV